MAKPQPPQFRESEVWRAVVAEQTGVPPMDAHDTLVAVRGSEYGDSWKLTDDFIKQHHDLLARAPSPFTLIMMHNKLMRALTSPTKQDHYDDIIGYAKLALKALEPQVIMMPGDELFVGSSNASGLTEKDQ